MVFFRLRSEKLEASRRLTISSSFGCRHVPVCGVEGVAGDADGFALGVEGANEEDMTRD